MTDRFVDPKTQKEMFKITDSNKESFTEDFKRKNYKDQADGISDNNERANTDTDTGKES